MSKFFLGLIAFSCLLACAVATNDASNTTQIQYATYSDNTCTTSTLKFNYTAGNCFYGTSVYASSDNAFVYSYSFTSGTDCAVANITAITKISAGVCGAIAGTGSSFTMYTIFTNSINNPAAPTAFPPTGFTTSTQYLNLTDSKPADTCDTTRTVTSAYPTPAASNPCQKYGDSQSYQAFASTDCSTSVAAYYNDATCGTLVRTVSQSVTFKSCVNGVAQTCSGAGLPDTSSLPIGYTSYDNNQCSTTDKTKKVLSLDGGCFAGKALSCGVVNGTNYFTSTNYANANCTGAVQGTPVYVVPDSCQFTSTSGLVVNASAFCSGGGGGNSAAAASVSAIVMIAAAFVALVAGRQL